MVSVSRGGQAAAKVVMPLEWKALPNTPQANWCLPPSDAGRESG